MKRLSKDYTFTSNEIMHMGIALSRSNDNFRHSSFYEFDPKKRKEMKKMQEWQNERVAIQNKLDDIFLELNPKSVLENTKFCAKIIGEDGVSHDADTFLLDSCYTLYWLDTQLCNGKKPSEEEKHYLYDGLKGEYDDLYDQFDKLHDKIDSVKWLVNRLFSVIKRKIFQ